MKRFLLFLALGAIVISANACDKKSTSPEETEKLPSTENEQGDNTINIPRAGSLEEMLSGSDLNEILSLKLSGEMDARDFNFIKWNIQNVEDIDLSGVKIKAYSGDNGTNEGYGETYAADEIPLGAFFYWCSHYENGAFVNNDNIHYDEGMPSLKRVTLPAGIKAIRRNAFARAYNLTEINFPEGLEVIDYVSFRYCTSLESVALPSTLKEIGLWAFTEMASIREVRCAATVPPALNDSFGTLTDSEGARGRVNTNGYDPSNHTAILYVPEGTVGAYANSEWSRFFKDIRSIQD